MPKKKTGQSKKKKRNQQNMREKHSQQRDITELACNQEMVCDSCNRRQKNRAFCYFCNAVQKLPMCANCGITKCFKGNDCLIRHPNIHVTGMRLVGAICDFCEAWVCHSKKCIVEHSCPCPLQDATCVECNRPLTDHGGRMYKCCTCDYWLCEDDQMEHQASCQQLDSETFQCKSCSKFGIYSCLRCKVCYCADHVKSNMITYTSKLKSFPCKKCQQPLHETNDLSISVRKHEYGRLLHGEAVSSRNEDYYNHVFDNNSNSNAAPAETNPFASFTYGANDNYNYGDESDESDEE